MTYAAFFYDAKSAPMSSLEAAQDWLITQCARHGMTPFQAMDRGLADIFQA